MRIFIAALLLSICGVTQAAADLHGLELCSLDATANYFCADPPNLKLAQDVEGRYLYAVANAKTVVELTAIRAQRDTFLAGFESCVSSSFEPEVRSPCFRKVLRAISEKLPKRNTGKSLGAAQDLAAANTEALTQGSARAKAAYASWTLCVQENIAVLDDNISPASDIAIVVRDACEAKIYGYARALSKADRLPSLFTESESKSLPAKTVSDLSDPVIYSKDVLTARAAKRAAASGAPAK